jgi:hypothetical protein
MSTFNDDSDATNRSAKRGWSIRKFRRLRWIQIIALITAFAAAAFVWWTVDLSIDASDSFTAEPPVTDWMGTAIIVFLLSMLTALGAWIVASLRSKK